MYPKQRQKERSEDLSHALRMGYEIDNTTTAIAAELHNQTGNIK
jgi:hypothetical protein